MLLLATTSELLVVHRDSTLRAASSFSKLLCIRHLQPVLRTLEGCVGICVSYTKPPTCRVVAGRSTSVMPGRV